MNSNLAIIKRAAEIRQESAPGAVLVPFEETTTAQKVWPIGKAWAEHHGWRPPARVIETVEELDSLPDDAAIRDRNGKVWGAKHDGVPSESLRSLLPVTVLFEGGTA